MEAADFHADFRFILWQPLSIWLLLLPLLISSLVPQPLEPFPPFIPFAWLSHLPFTGWEGALLSTEKA